MKKRFALVLFTAIQIWSLEGYGQISNFVYAISSPTPNVNYFAKVEISTGAITNLQLLPSSLDNLASSCIDNVSKKYYLSNGSSLIAFDAKADTISSITTLPTARFLQIQFNSCDSNIYGIKNNGTSLVFAKYNPVNNSMTDIASLETSSSFCIGCFSIIDPDSNTFISHNGNGLTTINLSTGEHFNTPIIDLPGEVFRNPAIKCSTHEIFGTSGHGDAFSTGYKHLATINTQTGNVTHVSDTSWQVGILKHWQGGSCINQITGDYFYAGAGTITSGTSNELIGINTTSGNLVYHHIINSGIGDLGFLQHFSQCGCQDSTTGLPTTHIIDFNIFPNPFSDRLNIQCGSDEQTELNIYDITLRKIVKQKILRLVVINTALYAPGLYYYELRDSKGIVQKGKVLKQ